MDGIPAVGRWAFNNLAGEENFPSLWKMPAQIFQALKRVGCVIDDNYFSRRWPLQKLCECIIANNVNDFSKGLVGLFAAGAIEMEAQKLPERVVIAASGAARKFGVRLPHLVAFCRQIVNREIEFDSVRWHPAGFSRSQCNLAPLIAFLSLEGDALACFDLRNNSSAWLLVGQDIDISGWVVDH